MFPAVRMRRSRATEWARRLIQESQLTPADLVLPVFVKDDIAAPEPVASMPGVARRNIQDTIQLAREVRDAGIPAMAIFPVIDPANKCAMGAHSRDASNLMCRALSEIKAAVPELGLIADVALDPYTTHGHDGVLTAAGTDIDNDATVAILAEQAVCQAAAGADVVAPSDMQDGRIAAVRAALDAAGHSNTLIMSYAAKYASAYYGPFRDAVGSGATLAKAGPKDKRTYQQDPANVQEALRETELDVNEGADWLMVKPGQPYLDVLAKVKLAHPGHPLFAYQVSGEYAAMAAAGQMGWLNFQDVMLESLLGFKRAGADGVFTYAALDAARWLQEQA